MSAPGQPVPYWVLDRDGFYYRGHIQTWTSHLHYAAPLSEELAEKLARRYPGAVVDKEMAYNVNPKETLASVGEPSANRAIEDAVLLAKRDGQSLERILVTTETAYNERS